MKSSDYIPDLDECYRQIRLHEMLPNILDHSEKVMQVSLAIADNLSDRSSVDRHLIAASALLHDIAKTRTIRTGELRHDKIGGEMLRDLGWESVARVVESHVFFENFSAVSPLEEREIVYYSDKRVKHNRVVSLDERIEDLVVRYGKSETVKDMIRENRKFIDSVERKIASFMNNEIESVISGL